MQKNLLIFVFVLFFQSSFSQDKSDIKINFGTSFGLNKFSSDTQTEKIKYTPQMGFRIGADYIFDRRDKLELETGLTLSYIRTKIDQPEYGLDIKYKYWYLGSHFIANYEVVPDLLYLGAGPFLDLGLFGNQDSASGNSGKLFTGKDGQDPPSKRLNYGAIFKANYLTDFTPFVNEIYLSYRLGLANIEGRDRSTQTFKLGTLSIGVRTTLDNLF